MNIKNMFSTIDTHTEGGPTRIITGGIPLLLGKTMKEKMSYFQSKMDNIRKMLMLEPRGDKGMYGAVITEPTDLSADVGVFFLTSSGYLEMCVHSAIGVAAAALETGLIQLTKQRQTIKLDTPAGLIDIEPNYKDERLKSLTIQTNPAFVHTIDASLDIGLKSPVNVSLVFSAVFFVLIDMKQTGISATQENLPDLIAVGVKALDTSNQTFNICHPDNPAINTIELAMLYEEIGEKRAMNAVISRAGSLDRSPCGAGTGAKMTFLFALNRLKLKEEYVNESVFGTKFTGRLIKAVNVGPYQGAVPQISGSAYITGIHQFILDKHDPLRDIS